MIRKRMAWVLLPILALVFTGCPKKPPEPPPTPIEMKADPIKPPPAPPQEVAEPVDVVDDQVEVDPLDSDNMRQVNEEAHRLGFSPDVHFELDQSDLRDEAREKLAKNAQFLKTHPQFTVTIEGHCDERGTNESTTAEDYMVSLGVSKMSMKTITYGEERPVCTMSDESCWWRNRRAHMVITGRK